jgi:predicted nucleic acid-binding protein
VFNFYVDESRGVMHDDTAKLFDEIASGKYRAYTSDYVVDELKRAPTNKSERMLELLTRFDIPVLTMRDDISPLADQYVAAGVIPEKYRADALHIALAAVYDLDMIISLNFQHIVKVKTIKMTGAINTINGYRAVEIYSPMEVVESGE